ncbi:DUF3822 family protein [Flavobacteriaceae bacterium S356]|uniref:DUF3822 family protein n=1 Tax=Asprobacillus argus TaxID=3076534 RepID=A0ABU3LDC7_9FLAO|nr:DUF3822 family protein [Flavobacteriaceae bacterium S356]
MIKTIVQKKTISKHIQEIIVRNLSIQFSLDGFSFCISNQDNEVYFFKSFEFPITTSVDNCLEEIISVFKTEEQLQTDFNSIFVIHQNYLNTIVPDKLFNEKELATYLKFSVKTLATDAFDFDSITDISAKNVYIPYTNINNFLFQNFGAFEFKHHTTVLIEKLLGKNKGSQFYLHVSKHHIDIILLKENDLHFYNSFKYNSKEDIIYYVLFIAEQLKMDTEEFMLVLLGDIKQESELYDILYKYIRNISFLENDNALLKKSDEFSNHSNFILLG